MILYNKLKKGISTALLGTAIYASAILPVQAQEAPQQVPQEQSQQVQLPPAIQRLSTEEQEMYKTNPSEFKDYNKLFEEFSKDENISEFESNALNVVLQRIKEYNIFVNPDFVKQVFKDYRNLYITLTFDKVLDSTEIEKLEKRLSATIKIVDERIYSNGALLPAFSETEEGNESLQFLQARKEDLKAFQKHLEYKKEWLNSSAVKGEFWHYGTGTWFYFGRANHGFKKVNNIHPIDGCIEDTLYESKEFYKTTDFKITSLSDEVPAKTKIPYWPGLAFGILWPFIVTLASMGLNKKREDPSGKEAFGMVANAFGGSLLLDGIHPLVYPARLILPIAYESYIWNKLRNKQPEIDSPTETKKPKEPIDPWCDLDEKPEEQIDPWKKVKSETK